MARLVFVRMPGQIPLCAAVVFHCPPRSSLASNTLTSNPAWIACFAATSPPGPAPITAMRALTPSRMMLIRNSCLRRRRLLRPDGRHHPTLGPVVGVVEECRGRVERRCVDSSGGQYPVTNFGEEQLKILCAT